MLRLRRLPRPQSIDGKDVSLSQFKGKVRKPACVHCVCFASQASSGGRVPDFSNEQGWVKQGRATGDEVHAPLRCRCCCL